MLIFDGKKIVSYEDFKYLGGIISKEWHWESIHLGKSNASVGRD